MRSSDPSNGLVRAAAILLGPTTGPTPALTAAVYRALALMPNVDSLGTVTTHSGMTGVGFGSTSPFFGKRAIIVDPDTGQLLELQNISPTSPYDAMGMSVERAFVLPSTRGLSNSGNSNVEWLDPVGSPAVVNGLPSSLSVQLPSVTAQVTAAESQGVFQSTSVLQNQLAHEFGHNFGGGPSLRRGALVLYLDFDGPTSQVPSFVSAVKDSGLFQTVTVTSGSDS